MKISKEYIRSFAGHFKIGMRIVKTVAAVFICCIIDYLRNVSPFQSTMAAIICIQPDPENTVNTAISRIFATLFGSITATLLLIVLDKTAIAMPSIPFYLLLSLLLIPLILITVKLGWPSAAALTCIIFLSIVLGDNKDSGVFMSALNRMVDTLVGVLVALAINVLIPNRMAVVTGGFDPEGAEPLPDQSGEDREKL